MTVLGAFIYEEGRVFRDSYLHQWRLEPSAFPWGRDDYLHYGLSHGLLWICLSALIAGGVIFTGTSIYDVGRSLIRRARRSTRKIRRSVHASESASNSETVDAILTYVVGGLLVIFLTCMYLAFAFLWTTSKGREKAMNEISSIDARQIGPATGRGPIPVRIERVVRGEIVGIQGFLIACGATACGVYDPIAKQTHIVPSDGVRKFHTIAESDLFAASHDDKGE
ncbi:hypothetical protein [Pandoraea commovens]|uniref:hypothetical protein n=1 Tax=Pandoraea commovens TaxID=2508289 RepID=UPI001242E89F|nr:hypothetical protein [Pandoraea commovens]